jgi:hypothetical protein
VIAREHKMHNQDFNYGEYATITSKSGLNNYKLSVKEWANKTNAIGLVAKAGRYGGTYAHKDIAFEFGMWISAEFKIYLIKEFQRLKEDEQKQFGLTAKQWQKLNPTLKGNIRDYADVYQLVCLANLESLNAHFISENISQNLRVEKLNKVAIKQMKIFLNDKSMKKLEGSI